eukprot:1847495-Rhodomonas_salina.2
MSPRSYQGERLVLCALTNLETADRKTWRFQLDPRCLRGLWPLSRGENRGGSAAHSVPVLHQPCPRPVPRRGNLLPVHVVLCADVVAPATRLGVGGCTRCGSTLPICYACATQSPVLTSHPLLGARRREESERDPTRCKPEGPVEAASERPRKVPVRHEKEGLR